MSPRNPSASAAAVEPIRLPRPLPLEEVQTPALLLDVDAFERNLRRMAEHARRHAIGLRPHAKTHKCPLVARRQLQLGAVGVCAAKISEAEVLVDAGIDEVLVTSPVVTVEKVRRAVALALRAPGLRLVVDSERGVELLDQAAGAAGQVVGVLVDLDPGVRRTGVAPGAPALALVERVAEKEFLRFDGLQAYAGHLQHVAGFTARRKRSRAALEPCLETRRLVEAAGHEVAIMTGGGTGTFDIDCELEGMTDLQVGSYAFMDVQYRAIGGPGSDELEAFEPALFVLATAISQPIPEAITLDAGFKAMAFEPESPPRLRRFPEHAYHYAGDEHGIVRFAGDERPLRLGDKAELVVSHCDPTVNLYDHYHLCRGDQVVELWPIPGRGCSQ
ncbi:MAG TPA: DSD1 family PLP-dependent enzyme [Thermoanaerobaculia bacterium]|nr:DSD1 family PLP-dependent enzyme [Thermoanaerobaculia bacterium]